MCTGTTSARTPNAGIWTRTGGDGGDEVAVADGEEGPADEACDGDGDGEVDGEATAELLGAAEANGVVLLEIEPKSAPTNRSRSTNVAATTSRLTPTVRRLTHPSVARRANLPVIATRA
ncbi:MAG TPA: hypothetical protein VGN19_01175 [Pedococcus sp.]|nr:hypothetical protein [Pedococcus sp.]